MIPNNAAADIVVATESVIRAAMFGYRRPSQRINALQVGLIKQILKKITFLLLSVSNFSYHKCFSEKYPYNQYDAYLIFDSNKFSTGNAWISSETA
jgi:hypothetical protein